ncbi:hypothetical protein C8T65DRAFT_117002 [Cerioporus squamosus]|nr:hypothetical protein C8T65DRAFT_117002 [Cerioporus squamosus]
MTIAGLQRACYLPNLQADRRLSVNTYFWDVDTTGQPHRVLIRYGQCEDWSHWRHYDVASVLRGWFWYWGQVHNYQSTSTVLSIRDGGLVGWNAATNLPTGNALHHPRVNFDSPNAYKVVVLDPFVPKNVTGIIYSETLKKFQVKAREQYPGSLGCLQHS